MKTADGSRSSLERLLRACDVAEVHRVHQDAAIRRDSEGGIDD